MEYVNNITAAITYQDTENSSGNGSKVFSSLFHCQCHNHVSTLSLCLLAHAYHVAFHQVKNISSLDVTEVFLVYMDKLVCSNIGRNQESIRQQQQQQSGSGRGAMWGALRYCQRLREISSTICSWEMNKTSPKNYLTPGLHVMGLCILTQIVYYMETSQTNFSQIN